MSDDTDKPEDQAEDAKAAGGDEPAEAGDGKAEAEDKGGMKLDEIQGSENPDEDEQEFAIGEAMIGDVTAIYDIPVQISAVLGRSSMQVSQLLKLGRGAVVELDRKVGEAIDIYVNNRLVARGEVVVVEDKLGVTMTEIVKSDRS